MGTGFLKMQYFLHWSGLLILVVMLDACVVGESADNPVLGIGLYDPNVTETDVRGAAFLHTGIMYTAGEPDTDSAGHPIRLPAFAGGSEYITGIWYGETSSINFNLLNNREHNHVYNRQPTEFESSPSNLFTGEKIIDSNNYSYVQVYDFVYETNSGIFQSVRTVFGVPTPQSALPDSGVVVYSGEADLVAYLNSGSTFHDMEADVTLSVDFAGTSDRVSGNFPGVRMVVDNFTGVPASIQLTSIIFDGLPITTTYLRKVHHFNHSTSESSVSIAEGDTDLIKTLPIVTGFFYGPAADEIGGYFEGSNASNGRLSGSFVARSPGAGS